jgi:hypothetical protein
MNFDKNKPIFDDFDDVDIDNSNTFQIFRGSRFRPKVNNKYNVQTEKLKQ